MKSWFRGLAVLAAPLALVACGDLFDVTNPTNIVDEELDDPLMITALANTPEAAFGEAYDDLILDAALPTDANAKKARSAVVAEQIMRFMRSPYPVRPTTYAPNSMLPPPDGTFPRS
jgi:hypothetical protein